VSTTDTAVMVARLEFLTVMMYETCPPFSGVVGKWVLSIVSDGAGGASTNDDCEVATEVPHEANPTAITVFETLPTKQAEVVPDSVTVAEAAGASEIAPFQAITPDELPFQVSAGAEAWPV
jgi:hypothetical protein